MTTTKPPPEHPDAQTPAVPIYHARELMEDGDQAKIVLDGKIYTLRLTRTSKLILTK